MQITLSGRTGRDVKTTDIPRQDGSGYFQVSDTALAVKVAEDTTDWYQLKFKGDALINAAGYIPKGSLTSVTGDLISSIGRILTAISKLNLSLISMKFSYHQNPKIEVRSNGCKRMSVRPLHPRSALY
jgi:hypothetical protein